MLRKSSNSKPNPASNLLIYSENNFCKCGWLKKQGGTFKTKKTRYFILKEGTLYYFANQTRYSFKGQICLKNLELSELEESNGEYSFSILPEIGKTCVYKNHLRYQFYCTDKIEAAQWVQQLKQNMYLKRGGGLFGTPLGTVACYLKKEHDYVPRIVYECCQRIREVGMDEEGIFRKNGQQSLVYEMKSNIDRGKYNWEDVDIHTICSLLKLYLRELPEPVIPFSHYDSLKAIGYRIDAEEDLNLVIEKLSSLPQENLQLLKYLCEFLLEVSTHTVNRMGISNLASVFSPNILRDEDTDPFIEETTSSIITITVAAMINRQADLFQFEYKPVKQSDTISDGFEDDDNYSISSDVPNVCTMLPLGNKNNHSTHSPNEVKKVGRAHSLPFYNYKIGDSCVNFSTRSSHHCVDGMNGGLNIEEHNENDTTTERQMLDNGGCLSGVLSTKIHDSCERCKVLEGQLLSMTAERDKYQHICLSEESNCLKLKDEVERLRLLLSMGHDDSLGDTADLS